MAAMTATGAALLAFVLLSFRFVRIPFGRFSHPPVYGLWGVVAPLSPSLLPALLLPAAAGWWAVASRRAPRWLLLTVLVGTGVVAAAALALVRGDAEHLIRGVGTGPTSPYYSSDLHFVEQYGVRGFAQNYPELMSRFHSAASVTHPPGTHLLLHALFKTFGAAHPLRVTTALAVLAMAAAVPAWAMGRALGGERAGRIAAVLFTAAPGPLLLAYTAMDAVFATVLAAATALLMVALFRRSPWIAAAGGAVLGVATVLTFASVFVALATAIAVAVQTRGLVATARLLGAAAGGGLAVLVLAWPALGVDLVGTYRAVPAIPPDIAYDPYWIVGGPVAWLVFAGVPIAALGVAGLVRRFPDARPATLPLALVLIMLAWAALPDEVTKLRAGEVERTWAFLYPVLAATAGVYADRWTRGTGRRGPLVVAALAMLSAAQAVLIQACWDTLF